MDNIGFEPIIPEGKGFTVLRTTPTVPVVHIWSAYKGYSNTSSYLCKQKETELQCPR